MSELFGVESHTITYHLKEIFQSGELQQSATTRKIRVVQKEGKLAEQEYEQNRAIRDQLYESDFDKVVKKIIK